MFVSSGFKAEFTFDTALILNGKTWLYTFEFFAIISLIFVFAWYKGVGKNHKKIMTATEKDKEIYTGLEQAHFQTDKELQQNFKTVEYSKLPNTDIEGIPIKAEETKKGY